MKEQAVALAHGASNSETALNLLREYLQAFILRSLHDCEAFRANVLRTALTLVRVTELVERCFLFPGVTVLHAQCSWAHRAELRQVVEARTYFFLFFIEFCCHGISFCV